MSFMFPVIVAYSFQMVFLFYYTNSFAQLYRPHQYYIITIIIIDCVSLLTLLVNDIYIYGTLPHSSHYGLDTPPLLAYYRLTHHLHND